MSEQGMAPNLFSTRWARTGTPVAALFVTQAVTVAMILYGDFNSVCKN